MSTDTLPRTLGDNTHASKHFHLPTLFLMCNRSKIEQEPPAIGPGPTTMATTIWPPIIDASQLGALPHEGGESSCANRLHVN